MLMRYDFHIGVEMLLHCVSDHTSQGEDQDDSLQVRKVYQAILCMETMSEQQMPSKTSAQAVSIHVLVIYSRVHGLPKVGSENYWP